MKPEAVLKEMVDAGQREVRGSCDLEAKAEELKLESPLQVLTVASLVQAEGKTHDDFRKMAEVVYNRLEADEHRDQRTAPVRLDRINYLKNQSKHPLSELEIRQNRGPVQHVHAQGSAARTDRQPG